MIAAATGGGFFCRALTLAEAARDVTGYCVGRPYSDGGADLFPAQATTGSTIANFVARRTGAYNDTKFGRNIKYA
jgi:hypothetical protein